MSLPDETDAAVLRARHRLAARARRRGERATCDRAGSTPARRSGCSRARSSTSTTATAPATRPKRSSTACSSRTRCPTTSPRCRSPAADVRDGRIRVATLVARAFPKAVPSNKDGRRKIVQGGVSLDGEVVTDADLDGRARRRRRQAPPTRPPQLGPPPRLSRILVAHCEPGYPARGRSLLPWVIVEPGTRLARRSGPASPARPRHGELHRLVAELLEAGRGRARRRRPAPRSPRWRSRTSRPCR